MGKLSFAVDVLLNYGSSTTCPYCGSEQTRALARKQLLLVLRQCDNCRLMYRWPKVTESRATAFYQQAYQQSGLTTELPDDSTLQQLCATNFQGTGRDFREQIQILQQMCPQGRVLDFGCSWGYGAFQLREAGYQVVGFEISKPRAAFGREKLRIDILDELSDLDKLPEAGFDAIYASHVLEHLPGLKPTFQTFRRLLKPTGTLMVLVPNCGGRKAATEGVKWGPMINEKHTLALDRMFFERNLPQFSFRVVTGSDPYDAARVQQAIETGSPLPAEGEELMVLATRT